MIRLIANLIFIKLLGWRIVGGLAPDIKKCVIAVAPHTSYWDFFVGVAVRPVTGIRSSFLVKMEVFKFAPLGWLIRNMGGIGVDRSKRNATLVDQVIKIFEERDHMVLTIAPEGTRSLVKEWKTGFYRIAVAAKVPIVPVSFDFSKKTVEFMEPFYPSGDMVGDVEKIRSKFIGVKGKHPELGVY